MKERPILFSAPMVRDILDGSKTQTRRIAKLNASGRVALSGKNWHCVDPDASLACPYGQPGDRLWVREAWYCDHFDVQRGPYLEVCRAKDLLYYRATDCDGSGATYTGFSGETMCNPWRPSIHMPRWASRITLEIVSVYVERLQDISEKDAKAEGSRVLTLANPPTYESAKDVYRILWEQINGRHSWDLNPWVWVVEFKVVEP